MKASAFVVGPQELAGAALIQLALEAGFDPVQPYRGLAKAEAQAHETPLLFFLCAAVADVASLKPMADAIRFSPSRKLRFSPLIYFARKPSTDNIKACINMGFDDVIALPIAAEQLTTRIGRQIGTLQIYYETATYFGPDRRERIGGAETDPRRGGGGEFHRIEIIRSPETGVDVLKDDLQMVL
ncbi:MAG: hypothetical protein ABIO40_06550 [Devosia sp.]